MPPERLLRAWEGLRIGGMLSRVFVCFAVFRAPQPLGLYRARFHPSLVNFTQEGMLSIFSGARALSGIAINIGEKARNVGFPCFVWRLFPMIRYIRASVIQTSLAACW